MTEVYQPGSAIEVATAQEAQAIRNLHPLTGTTVATVIDPWVGTPETLEAEVLYEVSNAIENQPRSLQKTIGPSELGMSCTRRLLHKLHGDPEPDRGIPWLPFIGTAVHASLAWVFAHCTDQSYPGESPRYLIEHRVQVGEVAGVPIIGSSDLFDTWSGSVYDHKCCGKTVIQEARRHGPSLQYRIQAHLYGRGFALQGYQVNRVFLLYWPRNEVSLSARYFWSEPYDESIALAALARATALTNLTQAVGIDAAVSLYPSCGDTRLCPYCAIPWAARPVDPDADPFGAPSRKVSP